MLMQLPKRQQLLLRDHHHTENKKGGKEDVRPGMQKHESSKLEVQLQLQMKKKRKQELREAQEKAEKGTAAEANRRVNVEDRENRDSQAHF